jgi:hypothetical protein
MDPEPATLAVFQPVFDEMLAVAQLTRAEHGLAAFDVAAEAFGRTPGGRAEPVRSVRTMVAVLGEICATSPQGHAVAVDAFPPDAVIKSHKGYLIGLHFLRLFLKEIRAAICDDAKFSQAGTAAGIDSKTMVTLVIAQAPSWMGLSNPVLGLVAALALVIVAQAGRSAFCQATDADIIDDVLRKGSFEDPDIDARG